MKITSMSTQITLTVTKVEYGTVEPSTFAVPVPDQGPDQVTRLPLGLAAAIVAAGVSIAAQAGTAAPELKAAETFDAAWKIIRDTHFDPGMNGLDWPAVRTELGPRAAGARTATASCAKSSRRCSAASASRTSRSFRRAATPPRRRPTSAATPASMSA